MRVLLAIAISFLITSFYGVPVGAVEPRPIADTFMKCKIKGKSPLKKYIGEILNGQGTAADSMLLANDGFLQIELHYREFKKGHDFILSTFIESENVPTLQELVNGKIHKFLGTSPLLVIKKSGLTRERTVMTPENSTVKGKIQIHDIIQNDDFENVARGRIAVQWPASMFDDVDTGTIVKERPKNGKITVSCKFDGWPLKN